MGFAPMPRMTASCGITREVRRRVEEGREKKAEAHAVDDGRVLELDASDLAAVLLGRDKRVDLAFHVELDALSLVRLLKGGADVAAENGLEGDALHANHVDAGELTLSDGSSCERGNLDE